MRGVVAALATGAAPIRVRLQAAEPHFGQVVRSELLNRTEEDLYMRIVAGLVEGGDEGDEGSVTDSIAALDEARASEIAGDMVRLYEVIADIDDESTRLPGS
jgi:hypothetical protein